MVVVNKPLDWHNQHMKRIEHPYAINHITSLTFNLSPLTTSPFCAINSGKSHVQLIYLPASQSLFSPTRYTMVSALSSVSVKTINPISHLSVTFNWRVLTWLQKIRDSLRSAHHIRRNIPRMNAESQDPLVLILLTHKLCKCQDSQFTWLIVTQSPRSQMCTHTTRRNNRFITALQHKWKESSRHEVRTPNIDIPCVPPDLWIGIRNQFHSSNDLSIVDQNIEFAKLFFDQFRCFFSALLGSDVQIDAQNLGFRTLGFCGSCRSVFLSDSRDERAPSAMWEAPACAKEVAMARLIPLDAPTTKTLLLRGE